MKAFLFLTLVVACLAQGADERVPACPEDGTPAGRGGATATSEVLAFYKYSYELDKNGANNELHIFLDIDDISVRQNQYLWMRVTSDSLNANTVDLNIKINVNSQSVEAAPNWFDGDLSSGDDSRTITYPALNITQNSDRVWFDMYPTDCSACSETIEFSVELAWLDDNSPFTWGSALLVDNIRSIVFDQAEGNFVNFYADFAADDKLFISLVYPDDSPLDQDSQIVLYWQKDSAPNTTHFDDKYPFDLPVDGDYTNEVRPFVAETTGTWWMSAYVLTQGGTSDPKFTVKPGFNFMPCAGAFTVTASSLLLALIPLTLLFSRQ